ncbi:hypothetical protein BU16DRAFT_312382 [Lophium mytilinum]|uniref:DUF7730 domain-containing protein n=1 Tax=Lophium mytilinum TaxID=390894 RepID=A0A6A6QY12_9PEZI|nr:hypothetical protein BU16DRAFT_312382 [Lophium mytilinum]
MSRRLENPVQTTGKTRVEEVENEAMPVLRRSLTLPLRSPSPIYYNDQPPLRRRYQRTLIQDACLLFRLPLELRTIVYEYVLGGWTLQPARNKTTGQLHLETAHFPGVKCTFPPPRRCPCNTGTLRPYCRCTRELTAERVWHCRLHCINRSSRCIAFQISSLLTCRAIYSEAIDIIYERNTFTITDIGVLLAMQKLVPPHRLQKIRTLTLQSGDISFFSMGWVARVHGTAATSDLLERLQPRFSPRYKVWEQGCAVLAGMSGLRRLVVDIDNATAQSSQEASKVGIMEPLINVRASELFEVMLHWAESPEELDVVDRGAQFTIVRKLAWR